MATKIAYEKGEEFVKQLKNYLLSNIEFTKYYFEKNSSINFHIPEATYLLWLDFSKTKLSHKEIKNRLLTQSKVALNDGVSFGNKAENYFRLNVTLRKKSLKNGLKQMVSAF